MITAAGAAPSRVARTAVWSARHHVVSLGSASTQFLGEVRRGGAQLQRANFLVVDDVVNMVSLEGRLQSPLSARRLRLHVFLRGRGQR